MLNVGANSGGNAFANVNFGQQRLASAGQGGQGGQTPQGLQRFGGNSGIDFSDFSTLGAASASGAGNYGVPQVNLNQPAPSTASGIGQRLSVSA
ncbi:MAG: hypothetical protein VKJ04_11270 [Vampirovibrionales bacterium]|nr:hypothetical protein [Vampirovibrionales bacterium]